MNRTLPRELQRAHLEALLIAHASFNRDLLDACDSTRLSPAANELLDMVAEWPIAGIEAIILCGPSDDAYVDRLRKRVAALTVLDLVSYSTRTLVSLVNRLPAIGPRRLEKAA